MLTKVREILQGGGPDKVGNRALKLSYISLYFDGGATSITSITHSITIASNTMLLGIFIQSQSGSIAPSNQAMLVRTSLLLTGRLVVSLASALHASAVLAVRGITLAP